MKKLLLASLMLASSTSVLAQEVLMRRPLPTVTGTPQQVPGQQPGDGGSGSGGNPSDGGETDPPPAASTSGFSLEPARVSSGGNPPPYQYFDPASDSYVFYWRAGPWQGSATCGQETTLTRNVECVRMVANKGSEANPQDAYGVGQPNWTPEPVAPSFCSGSPPPTTYTGDKAACPDNDVAVYPGAATPWNTPSWVAQSGGSVTCGDARYRVVDKSCVTAQANGGDRNFCGLKPGFAAWTDYPSDYYEVEWNFDEDYSGCSAQWVAREGAEQCNGAQAQKLQEYVCRRQDGTILEGSDAAACTGPKPADGWVTTGTCWKSRPISGGYCSGHATPVAVFSTSLPRDGVNDLAEQWFWQGHDWCVAGGYSCCELRTDFGKEGGGDAYSAQVQVIATNGSYTPFAWNGDDRSYKDAVSQKSWEGSWATITSTYEYRLPPR